MSLNATDLLGFEQDIADAFMARRIRAPIHLGGGNEEELISYFRRHVRREDWVFCSWRSHFHCLLKGVPANEVRDAIYAGRSVSLCFPDHHILSSGIVGGTAPIALGVAWSIQKSEPPPRRHVHVFIGDMTARAGVVREAMEYGARHGLPITWIVEDNGLSVMTPTEESWGPLENLPEIRRYSYKLTRPHAGTGEWVRF